MTKGCNSQGIQEAAVSEAFLVHEGAQSVIPSVGKFNYGRGIVCPCPCWRVRNGTAVGGMMFWEGEQWSQLANNANISSSPTSIPQSRKCRVAKLGSKSAATWNISEPTDSTRVWPASSGNANILWDPASKQRAKKNKPYLPKSVCYALSWATGRPQRAVPLHYLCQSCPAAQKALAARFWSFSASNMLLGLWETISWTATWAVQYPDNLPPMSHWDSSSSPVSRKCSQDLAKRCEHRHRSQHPSWTTMSTTQPQSQSKGQLILHGTLLGLERKSATMKSNETE